MRIKNIFVVALSAGLLLASSGRTAPALDPNFGTDGVALASFQDPHSILWESHALSASTDGSVLLAGSGIYWTGSVTSSETVILGRVLANGLPDERFGPGGIKPIALARFAASDGMIPEFLKVRAAVGSSDGRLWVAGAFARAWNAPYRPWICRFTPDGELDESFGTMGLVLLDPPRTPGNWPAVTAFAMDHDGSLAVLIRDLRQDGLATTAELRRLDANGQLDTTFAVNGTAEVSLGLPIESERLLIEPRPANGILVALGYRQRVEPWRSGATVMRFGPDGSRDTRYGDGGAREVLPGYDLVSLHGAAMQPDGQAVLLLAGAVVRLTPSGQLDAAFNPGPQGGSFLFLFGGSAWTRVGAGLVRTSDNKLLFGGGAGSLRVTRLLSNGTPDPAYTHSAETQVETPGLFESRGLTEVDEFLASSMALDAQGQLSIGGKFVRWLTSGPDEFGHYSRVPRHGFLVARITDGGPAPVRVGFVQTSVTVREGDLAYCPSARQGVCLAVQRQGPLDQSLTLQYQVKNGTAVAPLDFRVPYSGPHGTLEFLAGQRSASVFVPIREDDLREPFEDFTVELASPGDESVLDFERRVAVVTIEDASPPLQFLDHLAPPDDARLPFGEVAVGQTRASGIDLIKYHHAEGPPVLNQPFRFTARLEPPGSPFHLMSITCDEANNTNQLRSACGLRVEFAPVARGHFHRTLWVEYEGMDDPRYRGVLEFALTGLGVDEADLAVSLGLVDDGHWRSPGEIALYQVVVTNRGPLDVRQARVQVEVPSPLAFPPLHALPSQGTVAYDFGERRIVWDVGRLDRETAARLNCGVLIGPVAQPMKLSSAAWVETVDGPEDLRPGNNTNSTFLVVGGADLEAGVRVERLGDDRFQLWLNVRNRGPEAAEGVALQFWRDVDGPSRSSFREFRPIDPGLAPGQTLREKLINWTGDGRPWSAWVSSSPLPPGRYLQQRMVIEQGQVIETQYSDLWFRAELSTNATSGSAALVVQPRGTTLDPNPENDRHEVVLTKPPDQATARKECVVALIYYFQTGNLQPGFQANPGAASASRQRMANLESPPLSLAPFYAMREVMLQGEAGRQLVRLYERHSAELTRILLDLPDAVAVLSEGAELLAQFQAGYSLYLAGEGGAATVTSAMIDRVNRLADRLREAGSPELRAAMETERARFNQLQDFAGVSFSAWGSMLGLHVPQSPWLVTSSPRRLEDGTLKFEVNHAPHHAYTVWHSPVLEPSSWQQVVTDKIDVVGHTVHIRIPNPTHPAEFYRVRATPSSERPQD
jgi:uncharacterized delta-60 repeat protein